MFLPTKGMRRNYASSLRPSSRCCILIVSIAVLLLLLPATPRAARSAESEAKHVVDAAGTGGVDGIEQAHHLLWDNIKLEVSSKSSRSRRSSTADNTRRVDLYLGDENHTFRARKFKHLPQHSRPYSKVFQCSSSRRTREMLRHRIP